MAKLIAQSCSEDLRQDSWEMQSYKKEGDILTQFYRDKNGTDLKAITKFSSYEDVFGNPEIIFQEIYEV